MSSDVRIVNVTVTILGSIFYIVPNSGILTLGKGTKTQKPAIAGNSIQMIYSDNLDDAIGKFEFKLYPTQGNIINMAAIQDGKNANDVVIVAAGTTPETFTITAAAVTTDPPIAFSADGEVSYTLEGNPVT